MSKFYCQYCHSYYEKNYFKWLFTTLFHWFGYRMTKCPHCGHKSYVKPIRCNLRQQPRGKAGARNPIYAMVRIHPIAP